VMADSGRGGKKRRGERGNRCRLFLYNLVSETAAEEKEGEKGTIVGAMRNSKKRGRKRKPPSSSSTARSMCSKGEEENADPLHGRAGEKE